MKDFGNDTSFRIIDKRTTIHGPQSYELDFDMLCKGTSTLTLYSKVNLLPDQTMSVVPNHLHLSGGLDANFSMTFKSRLRVRVEQLIADKNNGLDVEDFQAVYELCTRRLLEMFSLTEHPGYYPVSATAIGFTYIDGLISHIKEELLYRGETLHDREVMATQLLSQDKLKNYMYSNENDELSTWFVELDRVAKVIGLKGLEETVNFIVDNDL